MKKNFEGQKLKSPIQDMFIYFFKFHFTDTECSVETLHLFKINPKQMYIIFHYFALENKVYNVVNPH